MIDRKSIGELLDEGEGVIRTCAQKCGRIDGYEFEDVCQEMRIHAMRIAEQYDPTRNIPWKSYLGSILRMRVLDFWREHGLHNRQGRKRKLWQINVSDYSIEDENGEPLFDAACASTCEADFAWLDFVQRAEREATPVRVIVLYSNGLKMSEIAQRIGISESRVSQLMSPKNPNLKQAYERIFYLLGVSQAA